MIHPHTEVRWIDDEVGCGVFATRFIPRGTVTWVRDRLDREFTPEEVWSFDEPHREIIERYSYRTATGRYLFCWDHTRFMNHSFRPACLPTPLGFEIAIRDIAAGEEMTNDYGALNIVEPFMPRAEPGSTRRRVCPDDLLRHAEEWDILLVEAMERFDGVEQPLAGWLGAALRAELVEMIRGERPWRSIGELHFRDRDGITTKDGD